MKIIDAQGRLGGRLNLLDLAAVLFLLSLTGTVSYGLAVAQHRALAIVSVEPRRIVVGGEPCLFVKGTGFDAGTTVRIGNYPDRPAYLDESTLQVRVEDDVLPGKYRVIVRNSRGRYAAFLDAVEIVWVPEISGVKPKRIYDTEAELEIFGKYFDQQCMVWIAGQELTHVLPGGSPTHLHRHGSAKENPLPLGAQSLTVINSGGQKTVLEKAVTVIPLPRIDSISPLIFPCGETVELTILGKNFMPGTVVGFGPYNLGEATFVSPEYLRVPITADHCERREYDMTFTVPDGPTVLLRREMVHAAKALSVSLRINFRPNPQEWEKLSFLKYLPEWKTLPPVKSRNTMPILPLLITASVEKIGREYVYSYQGRPVRANAPISVQINDKPFSGIVVRDPEVLLTEDHVRGTR